MTDEQPSANVTVYRCTVPECSAVIAMVPPGFAIEDYELSDRAALHTKEHHAGDSANNNVV